MKPSIAEVKSQIAYKMLTNIFRDAENFIKRVDDVYYALLHNSRNGINLAAVFEFHTLGALYDALRSEHKSHVDKLGAVLQSYAQPNKQISVKVAFEQFCIDQNFSLSDRNTLSIEYINLVGSTFNKLEAIYCIYMCSSLIFHLSLMPMFTDVSSWQVKDAIGVYLTLQRLSGYNYIPLKFVPHANISLLISWAERVLSKYDAIFTKTAISEHRAQHKQNKLREQFDDKACKKENYATLLNAFKSHYLSKDFTYHASVLDHNTQELYNMTGVITEDVHEFYVALADREMLLYRKLLYTSYQKLTEKWIEQARHKVSKPGKVVQAMREEFLSIDKKRSEEILKLTGDDPIKTILNHQYMERLSDAVDIMKNTPIKCNTAAFEDLWEEVTFKTPYEILSLYSENYHLAQDGFEVLESLGDNDGIKTASEIIRYLSFLFKVCKQRIAIEKDRYNLAVQNHSTDINQDKGSSDSSTLKTKFSLLNTNTIYVLLGDLADMTIYCRQAKAFAENLEIMTINTQLCGFKFIQKDIRSMPDLRMPESDPKKLLEQFLAFYIPIDVYLSDAQKRIADVDAEISELNNQMNILEGIIKERKSSMIVLEQQAQTVYEDLLADELRKMEIRKQEYMERMWRLQQKEREMLASVPTIIHEEIEEEVEQKPADPLPKHVEQYLAAARLPFDSGEKILMLQKALDSALIANDIYYRTYCKSALCETYFALADAFITQYEAKRAAAYSLASNRKEADEMQFSAVSSLGKVRQNALTALEHAHATESLIKIVEKDLEPQTIWGLTQYFPNNGSYKAFMDRINALTNEVTDLYMQYNQTRHSAKRTLKDDWYVGKAPKDASIASKVWYHAHKLQKGFQDLRSGLSDFIQSISQRSQGLNDLMQLGCIEFPPLAIAATSTALSIEQTTASQGIMLINTVAHPTDFCPLQNPIVPSGQSL